MLRRAFFIGVGAAGVGGFWKFLDEWYQPIESEYIESLSLGELSDTIQIRFTAEESKRREVHQYLTYHRGSGEIDEVSLMDHRRSRQSISAPEDVDSHGLALVDEQGNTIEDHDLDFGVL